MGLIDWLVVLCVGLKITGHLFVTWTQIGVFWVVGKIVTMLFMMLAMYLKEVMKND